MFSSYSYILVLNLYSKCKWGSCISHEFRVLSGVRQGGVISPHIFAVYLDDLVKLLKKSGVGCHIVGQIVSAIVYADDLCLLAPTRSSLQHLLLICQKYAEEWCISYNPKKSKLMIFRCVLRISLTGSVCPSVGWSVRPLVRPSVGP